MPPPPPHQAPLTPPLAAFHHRRIRRSSSTPVPPQKPTRRGRSGGVLSAENSVSVGGGGLGVKVFLGNESLQISQASLAPANETKPHLVPLLPTSPLGSGATTQRSGPNPRLAECEYDSLRSASDVTCGDPGGGGQQHQQHQLSCGGNLFIQILRVSKHFLDCKELKMVIC